MRDGQFLGFTLGDMMLRVGLVALALIAFLIGLYFLKQKTGSQGWRVRVPWRVHRAFHFVVWLVFKKVPWKPILIWGPWVVMILGVAFYAIENWRGKRAFEKFEAEMRGRGGSLVFEDLVSGVPVEKNIAKHPAVVPWIGKNRRPSSLETSGISGLSTSWRDYGRADPHDGNVRDVRRWLAPFDPKRSESDAAQRVLDLTAGHWAYLNELKAALAESDFGVTYERNEHDEYDAPYGLMLFQIGAARAFARRSFLHATLGRGEECAADVRAIILLAACIRPTLTSGTHFAGRGCHYAHGTALWEALRMQVLCEEHLREIDSLLGRIDLTVDLELSLRGERCVVLDRLERAKASRRDGLRMLGQVRSWIAGSSSSGWSDRWDDLWIRFAPSGWFDHERVMVGRTMDPWIEAVASREDDRIRYLPETMKLASLAMEPPRGLELLYAAHFDVLSSWVERALSLRTRIDMERVAIAMERFRLRHERYPVERAEIVPEFLAEWPIDATNGQELGFERKPDGTPRLFSLGKDAKHSKRDDQAWQYSGEESLRTE